MNMTTNNISVLAELERYGIGYEFLNAEEVGVKCPFHEDSAPSCHVHVERGIFICRASQCQEHGDIVGLLARYAKSTRKVILEDLGKRYTLNNEPSVSVNVVEKYHKRIWNAGPLLKALYDRKISDKTIRQRRLGEWQGRITIPVKNDSELYVNIRSYLPGAPGNEKMKNLRGRAKKLRLYPLDQMKYNKIVVCGGEIKALAAAEVLNKHGFGCVCATAGEGNWQQYLNSEFHGKEVWVMMDIDEAGVAATELICRHLNRVTSACNVVKLPLDIDRFPKGDVNDYLAISGDLLEVIQSSPAWTSKANRVLDREEPEKATLTQASHADWAGKRIRVTATANAVSPSPYVIPKELTVQCTRDQNECGICSVYTEDEEHVYQIHDESPVILEMVDRPRSAQQLSIQEEVGIPLSCRVCKFNVQTYYNVEDVRISPQLEITERNNEKCLQPAICIGEGLELNESYEFTGRMYPHPLTQQSTLMISKYKATQDALSSYKVQSDALEALEIFQPDEWTLESLECKLDDIYEDFEANVTNIFQRRKVHLFCDLAYHSPLFIHFDGKEIKGWVEILILGDSSQGKSETVINLQKFYGLGEKVECKNATVAGLLGGLQQFGSRWFVTWGLFPTHDRRLVILEELKGADTEVISKLTDMRSSGIAEIPKIEKRRTFARTRMIALSNPRSNRSIDQYNFGISAVLELIGSPEDVRRFDACLIVEKSEVDPAKVNALQVNRPQVEHVFKKQLCRDLVLWAWTVKQTIFEPEAQALILQSAIDLSKMFTEQIPIVDRGSIRYKLARLSAALAIRTFSSTLSGDAAIIRRCHVEYIVKMLIEVYTTDAFGYNDFTDAQAMHNTLLDEDQIVKRINETPYPEDVRKQLLHTDRIELIDLQDWCAWDRQEAQMFLSLLVRKHALSRDKRCYRKTSPFITLLKNMDVVSRPDFIEDEF